MRRRDYELLSRALKRGGDLDRFNPDRWEGYRWAVEDIANTLARDNPAFDKDRFLRDAGCCGPRMAVPRCMRVT